MLFKDISIFSSRGMQSRMVSAILVDGIMRNISVIMNLDQWLRRCCLKILLFLALVAILFSGAERFAQYCFELDRWFKRFCLKIFL